MATPQRTAAEAQGPLTPDQIEGAKTFEEFLDWAKPDLRERFQAQDGEVNLSEEQVRPFREATERAGGPAQVVLLGEDWCPDVQRTLPLLRHLAEAAGWQLRVLRRDENPDIMERFPARSGVPRIPTVLFLDTDGRLLNVWIERPQVAHDEVAAYTERTPEAERDMRTFHWEHRQSWREATLQEWEQALAKTTV